MNIFLLPVNKFQKQLLLSRQGKACSQLTFCPAPKKTSHAEICSNQPLSSVTSHEGFSSRAPPARVFSFSPTPKPFNTKFYFHQSPSPAEKTAWGRRAHDCGLLSPYLAPDQHSAPNLVSKSGPKTWSLNLVSKSDLNLVCSQLAFYANTKNLLTCFHQRAPFERVACEWFPVRAAFVGGRN